MKRRNFYWFFGVQEDFDDDVMIVDAPSKSSPLVGKGDIVDEVRKWFGCLEFYE